MRVERHFIWFLNRVPKFERDDQIHVSYEFSYKADMNFIDQNGQSFWMLIVNYNIPLSTLNVNFWIALIYDAGVWACLTADNHIKN